MKISNNSRRTGGTATRIDRNNGSKNIILIAVIVITTLLIIWVSILGKKAQDTVTVVMYKEGIYKNEVVTEQMLQPYEMLKGEYEKYSYTTDNGVKKRRILLWEERGTILNSFAAYTLKANTVAEYRDFIKSRIDNSDNVLYSYPGKTIVKLDVGDDDLRAFKTFLQPGDRINIIALYRTTEKVKQDDGFGETLVEVEVYREEVIFPDIMLADLLNQKGDSILDIYASYNDKTTYQQAALDSSEAFQTSVTPSTMLVALTPEEESQYYYYLGKKDVEFRISLPQRTE